MTFNLPIAGSGLSLTWSSEWTAGGTERPGWNAAGLGLGGWALDLLHRYDATSGVVLNGDGSWRPVRALPLSAGEQVVASYDGRLAYVFDVAGRQTRTVDARLGVTLLTFSYDDAGRLGGVRGSWNSAPVSLTVKRTSTGTVQALIGGSGAETNVFVDGDGRLVWLQGPTGGAVSFSLSGDGLIRTFWDATGGRSELDYDEAGRVVSVQDADGVTRHYRHAATTTSVEVHVTMPSGEVFRHRTEAKPDGLRRSFTSADGTSTTMTVDSNGRRQISLADGTTIDLITRPDQRFGWQAPQPSLRVETLPDGVQRRVVVSETVDFAPGDPLSVESLVRTTSIDGNDWLERFDGPARSMTMTDPAGRVSTVEVDGGGRIVRRVVPGQAASSYTYDPQGRLASETTGTGATASTTRYEYDTTGGELRIIRPDGADRHFLDAAGNLLRATGGDGDTVQFTYDAANRVIQVRPPGRPSFTFGYSAAGRETAYLPPSCGGENAAELSTFENGRLASVTGARSVDYRYDEAGRLTTVGFDRGRSSASYDPDTGSLARLTAPDGTTTDFTYTGRRLTGLRWAGRVNGSVSQTVDGAGKVRSETVNGEATVSLTYDPAGQLTGIDDLRLVRDPASGLATAQSLGVVTASWQYDSNGLLSRAVTTISGTTALDVRYERDAVQRINAITVKRAGQASSRTSFSFDSSGRLTAVAKSDGSTERSSLDGGGNRLTVTTDRVISATYDDRDRLTTWGGSVFEYAADGALSRRAAGRSVTTFDYDDLGALRAVTLPDGRRIEYVIDGNGRRIGRRVDGMTDAGYLYRPDGRVAATVDASGAVVGRFAYDDRGFLAIVQRDGRTYSVATDQLGSPLMLVDSASGEVAQAIEYDAWGNELANTNPGFIPFGFAGGLRDADTGLIRFGARDYDPTTGRWTAPDPIRFAAGDANLYRYTGGDPVNRIDPTGLYAGGDPWGRSRLGGGSQEPGSLGGGWASGGGDPSSGGSGFVNIECGPEGCTQTPTADPGGAGGAEEPPQEPQAPPPPSPPTGGGSGFTCVGVCPAPGGGTCVGYCSYGDPHLKTGDGRQIDFQAAGEFLAIVSADDTVVVQVRQEPFGDSTLVALNTAVAASINGDRVAVYTADGSPMTVNGIDEPRTDFSQRLAQGGIVERHGAVVTVDWPIGHRLTITREANHLNYSFTPAPGTGSAFRGLMGSADGDPSNDLTMRDGTPLDERPASSSDGLLKPLGDSWRIGQAESLFDYRPGESTETFTRLDFPSGPATLDGLTAGSREQAEAVCRAAGVQTEPTLSNCILDVGSTGDVSYAASAVTSEITQGVATLDGRARSVAVGGRTRGAIVDPGQRDRFTLDDRPGRVVYLEALGACVEELHWQMTRPDGIVRRVDLICNDLGRIELDQPGPYTIELYSEVGATGPYAFEVLPVPVSPDTTVEAGQVVSGALASAGEQRRYTFDASAGQVVSLDAQGDCDEGLLWQLVRPDGLVQRVDLICNDLPHVPLDESGQYAVEVFGQGRAVGSYRFELRAER